MRQSHSKFPPSRLVFGIGFLGHAVLYYSELLFPSLAMMKQMHMHPPPVLYQGPRTMQNVFLTWRLLFTRTPMKWEDTHPRIFPQHSAYMHTFASIRFKHNSMLPLFSLVSTVGVFALCIFPFPTEITTAKRKIFLWTYAAYSTSWRHCRIPRGASIRRNEFSEA